MPLSNPEIFASRGTSTRVFLERGDQAAERAQKLA